MTSEQERELREWAVQSHDERAGFLALTAIHEIARLRNMLNTAGARIAAQSELLSKRSDKPSIAEFYAGQPEVLK